MYKKAIMNPKKQIKNKLIIFLQDLDEKEMKRLEVYVHCSLFNKNHNVARLFQLLAKAHPHFKHINKHFIFKKLFPQKSQYQDHTIRTIMSQLTQLIKDFLAFTQYEQQKHHQKRCLLTALADRQLPHNLFEKELKAILNAQKETPTNVHFLHHQFRMAEISYQYANITTNRSNQKSTLQSAIAHLDNYYLAVKLRYAWIALNHQNVVNVDYEMGLFFEEILATLQQPNFTPTPLIQLYHRIVLLLLDIEEEQHYALLKELLHQHKAHFAIEVIHPFYILLINYCRLKTAKGKQTYIDEALHWYKVMLEQQLLEQDKYFSPHHFKNIVSIGLLVKEIDWVTQFIEDYHRQLDPKFRETLYLYNKSLCLFNQKNYQQSAIYLRQLQFSTATFIDVYHDMGYRLLLIKTYYETKEWDALLSALEALRVFVRRNTVISPQKAEAYAHFGKFVKQLVNHQVSTKEQIHALQQKLQAIVIIDQRNWLREKLEELKG